MTKTHLPPQQGGPHDLHPHDLHEVTSTNVEAGAQQYGVRAVDGRVNVGYDGTVMATYRLHTEGSGPSMAMQVRLPGGTGELPVAQQRALAHVWKGKLAAAPVTGDGMVLRFGPTLDQMDALVRLQIKRDPSAQTFIIAGVVAALVGIILTVIVSGY